MNITVDANILFSTLLTDGATRRIWFDPNMDLVAPKFLYTEFEKYRPLLEERSNFSKNEFDRLAYLVLEQIRFIPDESLNPFLPAAQSIIADEKDVLYMACALKENTAIWSNDAGFKQQSRVKIKTTTELIREAKN